MNPNYLQQFQNFDVEELLELLPRQLQRYAAKSRSMQFRDHNMIDNEHYEFLERQLIDFVSSSNLTADRTNYKIANIEFMDYFLLLEESRFGHLAGYEGLTNVHKQIALYFFRLIEKNRNIIDELIANQESYKTI